MKVAILSPESLPIPAINGGAVESLIDTIGEYNSKEGKLDLDIFSVYDKKLKITNDNSTKYIYFKKNPIIKFFDELIMIFVRIILGNREVVGLDYIWKLFVIECLKRQLIKTDYDLIVIENAIYLFNVFQSKKIFKKYEGKVIFHVHNLLNKSPKVDYRKLCCSIISISDFLHKNIHEHMGSSIPISTIYNGVDVKTFTQKISLDEKNKIYEKLNLLNNDFKIVYVGRIAPEKGVKELIKCFKTFNDPNMKLIIVGSCYFGSDTASIFEKEIQKEIENNKNIIQTGFVNKNEIWKYYSLADVIVLPSLWDEPLGLTMIEAQLSGNPLITTRSGGIVETVDKQYSILVSKDENIVTNLNSAIELIKNNKEEWRKKALHAKDRAIMCFSQERFYDSICNELLMRREENNEKEK